LSVGDQPLQKQFLHSAVAMLTFIGSSESCNAKALDDQTPRTPTVAHQD
jgi:hypothetical protein